MSELGEVVHFFHIVAESVVSAAKGGHQVSEWDVEAINVPEDDPYVANVPLVTFDEKGLVVYWYENENGGPAVYRPRAPYLRHWAEDIRSLFKEEE